MEHFLTNELHVAFQTDAKLSSHPIVQTVSNSDEITAIFDVISYNKVIFILNHILINILLIEFQLRKTVRAYFYFYSRVHLYSEC